MFGMVVFYFFMGHMVKIAVAIVAMAIKPSSVMMVSTSTCCMGYSRAMYVHHTIVMQTVTTMSSVASSQVMTFLRGYGVAGY
jgi:hypothetical protein